MFLSREIKYTFLRSFPVGNFSNVAYFMGLQNFLICEGNVESLRMFQSQFLSNLENSRPMMNVVCISVTAGLVLLSFFSSRVYKIKKRKIKKLKNT